MLGISFPLYSFCGKGFRYVGKAIKVIIILGGNNRE